MSSGGVQSTSPVIPAILARLDGPPGAHDHRRAARSAGPPSWTVPFRFTPVAVMMRHVTTRSTAPARRVPGGHTSLHRGKGTVPAMRHLGSLLAALIVVPVSWVLL